MVHSLLFLPTALSNKPAPTRNILPFTTPLRLRITVVRDGRFRVVLKGSLNG
jgi:hypothetical protein